MTTGRSPSSVAAGRVPTAVIAAVMLTTAAASSAATATVANGRHLRSTGHASTGSSAR